MNQASLELKVEGMTCNHCVQSVKKALEALTGVNEVDVQLAAKKVTISYEVGKVEAKALKAAIDEQGYEVVE